MLSQNSIRRFATATTVLSSFIGASLPTYVGEITTDAPASTARSPESDQTAQLLQRITELEQEVMELNKKAADYLPKMEAIQQAVNKLLEENDAALKQNDAIRGIADKLSSQLGEVLEKERERLRPRTFEITFLLLDVYGDGSPGRDCWSVAASANDIQQPIWDHKGDISDDQTRGNGPGPSGDQDSTRYLLDKSFRITVRGDQELTIKFFGTAHDRNKAVVTTTATFSAASNWGQEGNGHFANGYKLNRMGAVGDATEYNVFFAVKEVK